VERSIRGSIKSLPTNDANTAEVFSLSRLSASSDVIGPKNHSIDVVACRSVNSLSDDVITPLSLSSTTSQSNVSVGCGSISGMQYVGQSRASIVVGAKEVGCLTNSKSNTSIVSETVSRVTSIMSRLVLLVSPLLSMILFLSHLGFGSLSSDFLLIPVLA